MSRQSFNSKSSGIRQFPCFVNETTMCQYLILEIKSFDEWEGTREKYVKYFERGSTGARKGKTRFSTKGSASVTGSTNFYQFLFPSIVNFLF